MTRTQGDMWMPDKYFILENHKIHATVPIFGMVLNLLTLVTGKNFKDAMVANCIPASARIRKHIMNSPEIKTFIREHADLFWFLPDDRKEDVSDACLVETVLNYGGMDAVVRLLHLLGVDRAADIFFDSIRCSDRRKGNYHELTRNYFIHLFKKYAPQYSDESSD